MKQFSDMFPLISGGRKNIEKEKNVAKPVSTAVDGNDTDPAAEHYENAPEYPQQPVRQRTKFRNHCVRFRLWYIIGSIVLLAITLPLSFLVIVPAIVQKIIDDIELPVMNARIGAASAEDLLIAFTTVFPIPGGFSVRLDPFSLSSYNTFTPGFYPFTTVEMPESALRLQGDTTISINATSPVTNTTEVSKWVNATLNGETTAFSFRGSTRLRLGELNMPINLVKSVELPALNKLQGFDIADLEIILPAEPDGTNMRGNLSLPNAAGMEVDLGDLSYNASVADIVIANLTVSNVLLYRGNNTIPFRGRLLLDTILANAGTILTNSSTLDGGALNMIIRDGQAVVGGQHIPWVESVLANSPLLAAVPLIQLLQDALGGIFGPEMGANATEATSNAVERLLMGEASEEPGGSLVDRGTDGDTAAATPRPRGLSKDGELDVIIAARLYQDLLSSVIV